MQTTVQDAYYDDGPSIMPAAENFAGNQDNWGASADAWNAGEIETGEWNPTNPTGAVPVKKR